MDKPGHFTKLNMNAESGEYEGPDSGAKLH